MTKVDSYRSAVIAVAASASLNSTAGLIVRQVEVASEWQIIAWRGIGVVVGLSFIFCIQERGRILASCRQLSGWLLFGGVVSVSGFHLLHTRTAKHHGGQCLVRAQRGTARNRRAGEDISRRASKPCDLGGDVCGASRCRGDGR